MGDKWYLFVNVQPKDVLCQKIENQLFSISYSRRAVKETNVAVQDEGEEVEAEKHWNHSGSRQ